MSGYDLTKLGTGADSDPYQVSAEAIAAYARATNDEDPRHLSGALAPPTFAVVSANKQMARVMRTATNLFALHGEHDLMIERPIVPGMVLRTHAEVIGIIDTPAGGTVVVRGDTRDADGTPVNTQYLVVLTHRHPAPASVGIAAPDHRTPPEVVAGPPLAIVRQPLDPDQTRRYAEASGDRSPYTFDDEYARGLGLPGAIVHGLCIMAFLGRVVTAVVCEGDSRRLRRFSVRFTRLLPMQPGQVVTSRIWRRDGAGRFACETADRDDIPVIRHGLAEVAV